MWNNLKSRLIAFMYGRYGIDALYHALLVVWCVLWLCGALTRFALFDLLAWAVLAFMLYRAFSKNIVRRRAENEKFLKFWQPIKAFFTYQWRRLRECRTHVYRKCPQCGAVLRLPHRRGQHTAVCPRCANRFEVKIIL